MSRTYILANKRWCSETKNQHRHKRDPLRFFRAQKCTNVNTGFCLTPLVPSLTNLLYLYTRDVHHMTVYTYYICIDMHILYSLFTSISFPETIRTRTLCTHNFTNPFIFSLSLSMYIHKKILALRYYQNL